MFLFTLSVEQQNNVFIISAIKYNLKAKTLYHKYIINLIRNCKTVYLANRLSMFEDMYK